MSNVSTWIALVSALLSCYFAACHVALKTFSRAKLSDLLEAANGQDRLGRFVERGPKLLLMTGTVRTALNLVVILAVLSSVRQSAPTWLPLSRYILSFAVAGILLSVFGVAVPISWARYHPETLLAWSMRPLEAGLVLFTPLAAFLHGFDPVVRRITGGLPVEPSDSPLTEELMSVVQEHEQEGQVDQVQKQMIEALVELPTTTADEIMTPRTEVQGIEVQSSLEQVRSAILEAGHSRIPVYEDNLDHIVGILYAKDMLRFLGNDQPFELRKVLRDALMVPQTKPIGEMLAEFKSRKVHIAIVLDEYGGTAGLITIEDILEQIVGDIRDEYEPAEDSPLIRRVDDLSAEIDARVYIDDLNDELDLELPEDEDYDTVGGFVFSTLGHIPEVGEHFNYDRLRFTVTAAKRTKVLRVRLERLEHNSDQPGQTQPASEPNAQTG